MVEQTRTALPVRSKQYPAATRWGTDDSSSADVESVPGRIREESSLRLLNCMGIGEDIISRVNRHLLSTPGEFPKLDAVARRLCLGARTLRRRLQELDTGWPSRVVGHSLHSLGLHPLRQCVRRPSEGLRVDRARSGTHRVGSQWRVAIGDTALDQSNQEVFRAPDFGIHVNGHPGAHRTCPSKIRTCRLSHTAGHRPSRR